MSLITIAVACQVAKSARRHGCVASPYDPPTAEERRESRIETAKTLAISLAVACAFVGCVLGATLAEQAGIVWLSVLLQALVFLPFLAIAIGIVLGFVVILGAAV